MDEADKSQAEELQISEVKKQHAVLKQAGISRLHCVDCGAPIPEERRKAVPGCRRCYDCQTRVERGS